MFLLVFLMPRGSIQLLSFLAYLSKYCIWWLSVPTAANSSVSIHSTWFKPILMTCCAYSCTQYGLHAQYMLLPHPYDLLCLQLHTVRSRFYFSHFKYLLHVLRIIKCNKRNVIDFVSENDTALRGFNPGSRATETWCSPLHTSSPPLCFNDVILH
jgi:hypothetical protein